jgi:3'-5' exoribonuclease
MHTDIGALAPNQNIDDIYLARVCQLRTAKGGKHYLHADLGDKTGQITARLWNATDAMFQALGGAHFVRVTGRVEVYQDSLQLNLNTIRPVSDKDVNVEDFLPRSPRDVEEMFAKLRELAASVRNEHLSRLLSDFLGDGDFTARFKKAPAAVSYHQPYLGGLLEHTLAVATLADYVASRYPGLDRDLLMTGTLLHDIGKIEELSYATGFEYTDRGRLIGHLIIAVQMVQDRVRRIEGFPPHLFDLLSHLILSHHGEYEWGSPKLPMTAEAIALHHLDNLDAKVEASTRTIEGDRLTEGNWTEYSRMFQRQLYRGPRSLPAEEETGG